MTNREILTVAAEQSAIDLHCSAADFFTGEAKLVLSEPDPRARKYLTLPFSCDLASYGDNIVASVDSTTAPIVSDFIQTYPAEHCFETPNLHVLSDALSPLGLRICFMAEYFLPDPDALRALPCSYDLRLLYPADLHTLYRPEWSNALCENRKEGDCLALGAYDNGTLIGLAGCSADCDTMGQIGIDVLPAYRRRGVASALTSRLALELLSRGQVPFYCAAWSNLKSVRNAIKSGFRPAWVEMTAKEAGLVDRLNRQPQASTE